MLATTQGEEREARYIREWAIDKSCLEASSGLTVVLSLTNPHSGITVHFNHLHILTVERERKEEEGCLEFDRLEVLVV